MFSDRFLPSQTDKKIAINNNNQPNCFIFPIDQKTITLSVVSGDQPVPDLDRLDKLITVPDQDPSQTYFKIQYAFDPPSVWIGNNLLDGNLKITPINPDQPEDNLPTTILCGIDTTLTKPNTSLTPGNMLVITGDNPTLSRWLFQIIENIPDSIRQLQVTRLSPLEPSI